jgi:nucleotide-binding universal stress UspA family protein
MSNTASPTVVVGVDGSPASTAALAWADSYAKATGGQLRVVTAWAWPRMYGMPMVVDGWDPKAAAERVVKEAAATTSLPTDRIETAVVEGRAADVLLAACHDADLLVVGTHGHRHLDTVLLGSVSNHCVHHATVPTVVVR